MNLNFTTFSTIYMKLNIAYYIRSKTFYDFSIISISKILGAILGFFISVLIARILGSSEFGYFMLSISTLVVVLEIIGSEAADNGIVRFASFYHNTDKSKSSAIIKFIFRFKSITAIIFAIITILIFLFTLNLLTFNIYLVLSLLFGVIGGCFASLWRFSLAVLQSYENFTSYAIVNIIPSFLKVFLILIFMSFGFFSLNVALMVNVIAIIFSFMLGFLIVFKSFYHAKPLNRLLKSDILHFCKWIYLTNIFFALCTRLDLFILTYYTEPFEVGIYSASLNILAALDLIYVSILTVLWPAASKLTDKKQYSPYVKKQCLLSISLALIIIPIFIFSKDIVSLIYTIEYIDTVFPLKIMLVGYFFMICLNPFLLILYALKKPYILTFIYILLTVFLFISCILLVPRFGIVGSASAVSLTRFLGGLLIAFFAFKEMKIHELKTIRF